jgi:hypothetical protein
MVRPRRPGGRRKGGQPRTPVGPVISPSDDRRAQPRDVRSGAPAGARDPARRRAKLASCARSGSISALSLIDAPQRGAAYWRPATDSSAAVSASRPRCDSNALIWSSPGETAGRGCAAAGSGARPSTRRTTGARCASAAHHAGGIHDAGNRPPPAVCVAGGHRRGRS